MYNVYVVLILWEEMHFIYFSRFQCFDKDGRSHTHGMAARTDAAAHGSAIVLVLLCFMFVYALHVRLCVRHTSLQPAENSRTLVFTRRSQ